MDRFPREKRINMAKKVNKTFIKPKRVEEVILGKSFLLDLSIFFTLVCNQVGGEW